MRTPRETLSSSDITIPKDTAKNSGLLTNEKESRNFKTSQLLAIATSKGTNINDAERAFEILPDLRLATDIIVSETLSPKDLSMPKMNITIDASDIDVDLSDTDIIARLNKHFGEGGYYDLESKLYKFLEESLVTAGAVCLLTLKKTEIDDFINQKRSSRATVSTENFKQTKFKHELGILEKKKAGSKSFLSDLNINITDNINKLKESVIDMYDLEYRLKELGMENAKGNYLSFVDVGRSASDDESHPIVFKLPTESVIPVHVPGEPSKHVGYYILCENGYPISHKEDSTEVAKLERRIKEILNGGDQAYKNVITVGKDSSGMKEKITPKEYLDAFSSKVRDELKQSLKGGVYRKELEVSSHEDAYSLMFNMTLHKRNVDVIYVPAGMLNYVAFDHDARGIGTSLIEKNKLFITIRASMMIADIFGAMRNSVPQTKVNVTLDEDDDDHYQTIEIIKDKISRMTGAKFPVGILSPSDILDALQKASINMNIDGGTAFPSTSVEVEDTQRNVAVSDSDLSENMKKINLSGMGVSPEKVDRALEGDYAISIATTNFLEARRIMVRQKTFEGHISNFIKNYVRLSGTLRKAFSDIDSEKTDRIIERIKFKLPNAVSNSLEMNLQAYERASDLIEAMVEDQINENMLRDILQGDYMRDMLDGYREIIASHFKAEWAREENIMPQILKLSGEDNGDISDAIKSKLGNIIKMASELTEHAIKSETKTAKKINKAVEKSRDAGPQEEQSTAVSEPAGEEEAGIFEDAPVVTPDAPEEDDEEETPPVDEGGDVTE